MASAYTSKLMADLQVSYSELIPLLFSHAALIERQPSHHGASVAARQDQNRCLYLIIVPFSFVLVNQLIIASELPVRSQRCITAICAAPAGLKYIFLRVVPVIIFNSSSWNTFCCFVVVTDLTLQNGIAKVVSSYSGPKFKPLPETYAESSFVFTEVSASFFQAWTSRPMNLI